jgi:hypothetical protein
MRSKALATFVLAAAAAALDPARSADGAMAVKEKAERVLTIQRNERGDSERLIAEAFATLTAAELDSTAIKSYDTRTLELLFQATTVVANDASRSDLIPVMETIFGEAYGRGFVGDMIEQLHRAFVRERDWDKAKALQLRFPWKALNVPEVHVGSGPVDGPAVYEVSHDGKVLTLQQVDIASRPIIVAVVSGGCHFSQEADAAIAADPRLSQALAEIAIYVDASPSASNLTAIAENNRTQKYKVRVLHKASGWPGLDFRRTPSFYFLKDGHIVHSVVGMGPNLAAELRMGLTKLGL